MIVNARETAVWHAHPLIRSSPSSVDHACMDSAFQRSLLLASARHKSYLPARDGSNFPTCSRTLVRCLSGLHWHASRSKHRAATSFAVRRGPISPSRKDLSGLQDTAVTAPPTAVTTPPSTNRRPTSTVEPANWRAVHRATGAAYKTPESTALCSHVSGTSSRLPRWLAGQRPSSPRTR